VYTLFQQELHKVLYLLLEIRGEPLNLFNQSIHRNLLGTFSPSAFLLKIVP